ncbi:UNVERIFIED_CONTAM: hypothetical protein K2H54_030404 [Gekko kuhli]
MAGSPQDPSEGHGKMASRSHIGFGQEDPSSYPNPLSFALDNFPPSGHHVMTNATPPPPLPRATLFYDSGLCTNPTAFTRPGMKSLSEENVFCLKSPSGF